MQPSGLVLDLPSNKWMFPLQPRTSCVYKCCSFVLYSKINLSKCPAYESLLFSNEINLISHAFKCFPIKDKYVSSIYISAPPPLNSWVVLYTSNSMMVLVTGGEKTKSIPANNWWQNPYQVLAKVHASYISSLIIYT